MFLLVLVSVSMIMLVTVSASISFCIEYEKFVIVLGIRINL